MYDIRVKMPVGALMLSSQSGRGGVKVSEKDKNSEENKDLHKKDNEKIPNNESKRPKNGGR